MGRGAQMAQTLMNWIRVAYAQFRENRVLDAQQRRQLASADTPEEFFCLILKYSFSFSYMFD